MLCISFLKLCKILIYHETTVKYLFRYRLLKCILNIDCKLDIFDRLIAISFMSNHRLLTCHGLISKIFFVSISSHGLYT